MAMLQFVYDFFQYPALSETLAVPDFFVDKIWGQDEILSVIENLSLKAITRTGNDSF